MPKYDVAVAGAGLGGLAAAALMSKSGKKVILFESGSSLDAVLGVRDFDGFRFYPGPSLSYGFEPGGAFQEIFAKLGMTVNGLKHASEFQVALPDRRITVFENQEKTLEELRREFPKEHPSIVKLYRDLKKEAARVSKSRIATYFARHKPAFSFMRKYRLSDECMVFFDIQTRYFFQKPLTRISLATLMTLCEAPPMEFYGWTKKLAEHFLAVFKKNGGAIRSSEAPAEIAFRNNRAVGIRTGQDVTEADRILLNMPQPGMVTFYLGILNDVVPVGMSRNVLYLPDYAKPDAFLTLSLSAHDDAAASPQGARAFTVSFQAPPGQQHDHPEPIGSLSGIIPFLGDNVFFVEPPQPAVFSGTLQGDLSLKPVRFSDKQPLLSRTSKRNVYMLHDDQMMLLELMTAVKKIAKSIV